MGNETHKNLLHEKFLTRIINKVCKEALFIHTRVTLEYFNFKRENVIKRFGVYLYCFSNNCMLPSDCWRKLPGNDPHLNHHDYSFNNSLDLWVNSFFKWNLPVNTISITVWWPSLVDAQAYVDPLQKDRYAVTHRPRLHQTTGNSPESGTPT